MVWTAKLKKIRSRMKPELSTNACSVKMVWFFCKASHSGCHSTVCSAYEAARYSARESHHYVTVFFPAFPETPSSSQQQRRTVSTTVAPGFAMFPWHPKWKVQCIYSASSHPCFCVMLFFCFFFELETAWCFGRCLANPANILCHSGATFPGQELVICLLKTLDLN